MRRSYCRPPTSPPARPQSWASPRGPVERAAERSAGRATLVPPTRRRPAMCWSCDNPDGDYLAEVVLPTIERCGWMVQAVSGRPRLAYTVGLTERGLPELVTTGLAPARAHVLLNSVAAAGLVLVPGESVQVGEQVLEVVEVPHPDAHLFTALALYGDALRAVQLVWADERGHWPWCRAHRGSRGGQAVLGPRTERREAS